MLVKFNIQVIRHRWTPTSFRDSGPAKIYVYVHITNKEQWRVALTDPVELLFTSHRPHCPHAGDRENDIFRSFLKFLKKWLNIGRYVLQVVGFRLQVEI